jgi:hypothetical protein
MKIYFLSLFLLIINIRSDSNSEEFYYDEELPQLEEDLTQNNKKLEKFNNTITTKNNEILPVIFYNIGSNSCFTYKEIRLYIN